MLKNICARAQNWTHPVFVTLHLQPTWVLIIHDKSTSSTLRVQWKFTLIELGISVPYAVTKGNTISRVLFSPSTANLSTGLTVNKHKINPRQADAPRLHTVNNAENYSPSQTRTSFQKRPCFINNRLPLFCSKSTKSLWGDKTGKKIHCNQPPLYKGSGFIQHTIWKRNLVWYQYFPSSLFVNELTFHGLTALGREKKIQVSKPFFRSATKFTSFTTSTG